MTLPDELESDRQLILGFLRGEIDEKNRPDLFEEDVLMFAVWALEQGDPDWLLGQLSNREWPAHLRVQILRLIRWHHAEGYAILSREVPQLLWPPPAPESEPTISTRPPGEPQPWEKDPTTLSPSASSLHAECEWVPEWIGSDVHCRKRRPVPEGRSLRILMFEGWGIRVTDWDGEEISIRWEDVQVWQKFFETWLSSHYGYGFRLADGRSRAFGGKYMYMRGLRPIRATQVVPKPGVTTPVTAEQFGRLLDAGITRAQVPLLLRRCDAGQPVSFGPLTVSQYGIGSRGRWFSWREIDEVGITGPTIAYFRRVEVSRIETIKTFFLSPIQVPYKEVPNISVFLALAEEMLRRQRRSSAKGH